MKPDRLAQLFIVLCTVGIAVAIYHAYTEVTYNFSACNLNSAISCGTVFESGYDSVFGIPFYVLGLIWFPICLVLGLLVTRKPGSLSSQYLTPFLMIGNIFTIYLWYLEIFVIHAYCPICISLYVINYVLTGITLLSNELRREP